MGTTLSDVAAEVRDNQISETNVLVAQSVTRGITEASALFTREVESLEKDVNALGDDLSGSLLEFLRPAPEAFRFLRDMIKLATSGVRVIRGYVGSAGEVLKTTREAAREARDDAGALSIGDLKACVDILAKEEAGQKKRKAPRQCDAE